ncbi:MAG: phosphotransferase [Pseudomonadota bacterium]
MNVQHALDMMPQKGTMRLLERIDDADATAITCRARDHRDPDYPLRLDGKLMGVTLVELGAQAAAAHASLHGVGGHHTGLLVTLQDVTVDRPDGDAAIGCFVAHAEQLFFDEGVARYRFAVRDERGDYVRGEAMLKMRAIKR